MPTQVSENRIDQLLGQTELEKAVDLERLAQEYHEAGKPQKEFAAYDNAGRIYQKIGDPLKAAMCFAAAATSWDIHTGWQSLQNSATRNYLAGLEAVKARHYDYAESLFRNAAILFYKEGDFDRFSESILKTHAVRRKKGWMIAFDQLPDYSSAAIKQDLVTRVKSLLDVIASFISEVFWGHGERPFRTFFLANGVLIGCAVVYASIGRVVVSGLERSLTFFESLYFSVITFTTLGYGDYSPVGITRLVAMFEVLTGIVIIPLFLVALTRRFLRIHG